MRYSAILILTVATSLASMTGLATAQTLEEALTQAYTSNPRLLSQRASLRATDEGVPRAISGYRPTLQIDGSVGRRHLDTEAARTNFEDSTTTDPASVGLNLSQPIWRGGATTAQTEGAENRVFSGRAQLVETEQQILVAAATAYMNVVREQSVVALNINNEQVLDRQLQATRDRFEVGEVTRTDVSQAEARLATAAAARIEAEGLLEISRAAYENEIGRVPDILQFPDLAGRFELPLDENTAQMLALERNPAIHRASFSERAAISDISAAKSGLLPQIFLNGNVERTWEPNSFFDQTDDASVTVNVRIPLFQSGAEYSGVRERHQVAVQRTRELEAARRNVVKAVSTAWQQLNTARARIRAFESAVKANEIALYGVQQEADVGARSVLDVLDAEQELFQARVSLVRAETDEVIASFEMLRMVGNMTANYLRLPTTFYDPVKHFDEVRGKWIGFGSDD